MSNIYAVDIMAHEVHKKDSPMNKILIFMHRILEFVYIFRDLSKCFHIDFLSV